MVDWLHSVPPVAVYLVVALVVGVESIGIPLPGETVLIGAALLAAQGTVSAAAVATAAVVGASVGDSVGYAVGRRRGEQLMLAVSRRFPRHLDAERIAGARRLMERRGAWAVFTGRFVALLRILAGPLAGTLRMPYRRFLVANVAGAVVWASATTTVIVLVGTAAERWITDIAWAGAAAVVLIGVGALVMVRRRNRHRPPAVLGGLVDGLVDGMVEPGV